MNTQENIKQVLPEVVGTCKNCYHPVVRQQPYFSTKPIVNDGWYLYRCTNEECHNCTGMELRDNELYFLDFVDIKKNTSLLKILNKAKIIYFNNIKRKRRFSNEK